MHYLTRILTAWNAVGDTRRTIIMLCISALSLLLSLLDALPFDAAWVAVLLCGLPIIKEGAEGLFTRFDIRADVLVSLALIAAVYIDEIFAAGEVAFIMQLGSLLEEMTVARARAGIEKLVQMTPQTARLLTNGTERIIPAADVRVGDTLRVLPGETIPVDGDITEGQTSINQAVLTGESLPVDMGPGDAVSSGTVNQFDAFVMRATRVGEDSSLQRMIRLVQSADAGKARIVHLADRWATWIVVAALTAAALTLWITGDSIRAVTILVVFCPCALVLATPTAIMAAIGNATHHGFLVCEGDALERLAQVRRMAFDKTGTLTYGKPEVIAVHPAATAQQTPETTEQALYRLTAAVESLSEHPLGKAVVRGYTGRYTAPLPACTAFRLRLGRGVSGIVDGQTVQAGSEAYMRDCGTPLPDAVQTAARDYLRQGATVIYTAVDGTLAGFVAVADTLRPGAAAMVRALRQLRVQPVLLTGDHASAAQHIAAEVHIDEVRAQCLPEDKLRAIDGYAHQGTPVAMIGDGINDAPALKKATVGIAMGAVGSDIAVAAADITLVDDNIAELPHLVALSQRMMTTIKGNLAFSLGLNFLAIGLAATGLLGPVAGALVHNAGSVAVVLNSARLLRLRPRR